MTLNLEKENLRIFLRSGLWGLLLSAPLYLILFIKGCDNTIPVEKPNLHGARQFFPIDVDTVKPKQIPKVNHNLVLRGSDTLFNVLWTQIISPQDVTPRNLAILQKWVQSNTVQDTTIKK